ncbi:MAG TPA: hypothetical protein PLN93_11990 [Vicinamibacterales bacterium]|nr:hypothetical protein [Vicinamibacterales bacterium]HOQ61053.1 hypothetical protein [Vicinamibacterales bacterium]HPK72651.1 hypothetical protein [Vicinamibacterales bacterium]
MRRLAFSGVVFAALMAALLVAGPSGVFAQSPRGRGAGQGGSAAQPRGGGAAVSPGGASSGGGSRQPSSAAPRSGRAGGGNAGSSAGREARPRDGGGSWRSPADGQAAGRARDAGGADVVGVPWYSRPRGGNPSTGTAIPRADAPAPQGGGGYYVFNQNYYNGYYGYRYNPFNWYGNVWGYGAFGLGYFYYDPFWWSYEDYRYRNYGGYSSLPYGYGYGYGPAGYGDGYATGTREPMGGVRLKVKPNTASVYVDGYYAGRVDDFDNMFQKLQLPLGLHRIEIAAPGYKPLVFELNIRSWDTITYEAWLEPIAR